MGYIRFMAPFYWLNGAVPFAYIVLRQYMTSPVLIERTGFLNIAREYEIFFLVAIMFGINYRKRATIDGIIAMLLMYTKAGVLAASYYLDPRVFGYMFAYCAVLFVSVGQPKYKGPEKITKLNPPTLELQVKRCGGTKATKDQKNASWLVYFYADWSDHCLQHDAMVASLSLEYSSQHLLFGKVDVNQYPDLAKEFEIEVSSTSWQLPTFILFQQGHEVFRVPHRDPNGKIPRVLLDKKGVTAVFRLEDLSSGKKTNFQKKKSKTFKNL